MFTWREYAVSRRGGSWPEGECLVLDAGRGEPVAEVRDEPWPEVLSRPWPDGASGRPFLMRLFGVDRYPRQSRTVVRRRPDGHPLVRLHRRQPLFQTTVGIFDAEDRRVGYCRWPFKGSGPRDRFDLVRVDHRPFATVAAAGAGAYRLVGSQGGLDLAALTISPGSLRACGPVEGRVSLSDAAADLDGGELLLLAAAVVFFLRW